LTGNGAVNANNPSTGTLPISPVLPGAAFSHSFAVSGSVGNGTVNTSQLGLFGLNFENTGSDHYQISLTLNYQLDAATGGQLADSTIDLDYFNETSSFAGFDHVEASAFTLGNAELIGSSGIFNFTLTPGSAEALYANVRITGNLEASPVPLPASFWLLFAGLSGIVSLGKCRRQQA
ncbi:MAG: VPLPA-CTERM sorting domain-containing protein, partial [Methylomonas sp.]